jgi:predicted amidohydrolase YtcJ
LFGKSRSDKSVLLKAKHVVIENAGLIFEPILYRFQTREQMSSNITIFTAKKIITMNPVRPEATAVAVRDSRILGVGTLDEVKGWGEYTLDETFKDKILTPGLIEAHCHTFGGKLWMYPYIGYFDRNGPDGKLWKGCTSLEAVITKLKEIETAMSDPDETLIAWGLDPIYFEGDRLVATHLDQVSDTRPIFVLHASGHLAVVNSALMQQQGINESTNAEGVPKRADGKPLGELQEPAAMYLAGDILENLFRSNRDPEVWKNNGKLAQNVGCTTVTDLGFVGLDDEAVKILHSIIDDPDYPVRASVLYGAFMREEGSDIEQMADQAAGLLEQSSDKLRLGLVKVLLDGSIQGYTARLRSPGYIGREENGIWITPPETFKDIVLPFHKRGLTIHCHCNGDEAVDVFLDTVEEMQAEASWPDARHTVQHCQLTTIDQYERMAALNMCANIFSNHIFYWGDQHYSSTVGPDRAQRMEACATAKKLGIHFALHSDSPVTPFSQLHVAWCAVNRQTATGRTLGEYEKLSVYDALYAVTLDAAYTLKLDHDIGSIEPGKLADFTVLEEDPFEIDPMKLKDIPVWGTILGGKPIKATKQD